MLKGIRRSENMLSAPNASATVGTVTVTNTNGRITVTGTTNAEILSTDTAWKNAFSFLLKAGTYYVSGSASGGVSSYIRNASDDSRISLPNASFTISEDTQCYIGFYLYQNTNNDFNVMLNLGSTPLPYEPYGDIPKDITRIAMKGKQLWDGVPHNGYITGTGVQFRTNGGTSAFIPCKPNTTYSVNISSVISTNRFYISTCDSSPVDYSEVTSIVTASNRTYYTFTTNSTAAYIIVYLNSATNSNINGLMVNEGDTILPYVPYGMVEGWEVRDNQDRLIWGRENIFEGTDSIPFKGYGVPISTIEVDGNGQQNGTPTPDNIVITEMCGVRTSNLFDKSNTTGIISGTYINQSGELISSTYYYLSYPIKLTIGETYTWSFSSDTVKHSAPTVGFYDSEDHLLSVATHSSNIFHFSFTVPQGCAYVRASVYKREPAYTFDPMLISGTVEQADAVPLTWYEPYGWKIPITCAGQTVPVYLGQTQTVRKIGKLVLDGTENWQARGGDPSNVYFCSNADLGISTVGGYGICNAYRYTSGTSFNTLEDKAFLIGANNTGFRDTGFQYLVNFKSFLAAQYAAGTPVTVWYVLAEPETTIVNEPLAKIGDYADTLTVTNQDVNINIPNGACLLKVDTTIPPSKLTISAHVKSATNWKEFRNYIRNGYGPIMYPVGTILYDNFGTETGTAYRVVAYDKHFDPSLTAQGYNHSVTLCEELLEDIYVFDNIEAMLYVETAIPAGTYKFTIPNYDATYGGNKTYYFTSTGDVPTDSHIVLKWDYQKPPASVTAYAGPNPQTKTTAITGFNSLALTEWVDGESPAAIDLGTVGGPTTQLGTSNFGKMNHIHRARYGSNNYLQSGVRQYINASTAANTWWQPQTIFDRPYSQRTQNGKLMKLNQDMVSVLAKPEIQSRTNNYFETTSLDGTTFTLSANYTITTDKMFLLSPMEVGLTTTDTTVGTTLDYYIDATNDKRIKYRKSDNTAYYWWLRTPYPTYAHIVRDVYSSGALNNNVASNSYGVAPACIIQ